MKHLILILMLVMLKFMCSAQGIDTLILPEPVHQGGKPLMQALCDRHSSRNFIEKELSQQQTADMLWAANGINRPDGRRTAPSARNKQEIDIYLITAKGVFVYDAVKNCLVCIAEEDFREKTGGQPFVKVAAVNILYICNKYKSA